MIERINFPVDGKEHRLVQIIHEGKEKYIFPEDRNTTHAYMLKKYLNDNKVIYKEMLSVEEHVVPSPKGEKYHVLGMGYVLMNPTTKIYSGENGGSVGYGMNLDAESLKRFEDELREEGWEVR